MVFTKTSSDGSFLLRPQHLQNLHVWAIAGATVAWLGFTIAYAISVATNGSILPASTSPSITVTLLRFLSEGVSLLLNALIAGTLNAVLWTAASTGGGLSLSTLLGLSTSTSTYGLLELLFFWRSAGSGTDKHRIVAIIRLLLAVTIPLMGVLILSTVNYNMTYTVNTTIPVTAGIGAFNATQAEDWIPSWLAFLFSLASYNVLFDTTSSVTITPAICYGTPCSTYYFTGGVAFLDPDPFTQPSLAPEADVIIVREAQGLLVSYWEISSPESEGIPADQVQCRVFGVEGGAFELCFASSTLNIDHIVAGWSSCPSEVASVGQCLSNTTWQNTWTLGTAMTVKFATADTTYSRLNSSILYIKDLTPSDDVYSLPLNDYLSTFSRIFSSDVDSNGNIRINSTTTALLNYALIAIGGGVVSPIEVLRSWLVAPLIMFQPNSYTNPMSRTASPNAPVPYLPEFDALADLAKSGWRVSIAPWTAILFLILALAIYFVCLICLFLTLMIQGPRSTRFPLIDFASRAIAKGFSDGSLATVLNGTGNGDEEGLRKRLFDKVVFLGDVSTPSVCHENGQEDRVESGKIGFSLVGDVGPLKAGNTYE